MTRNTLKIIACVSMLVDHIGYILMPEVAFLRYVGRLAMPIFAFFIGEGCLYTRDRKKYFTRIFTLGVVCQLFYIGEYLFTKSSNPFYLNILFTFSASVLLCSALIASVEEREQGRKGKSGYILGALLVLFFVLCKLREENIIPLEFDYGFGGIILPVFAAVSKDRKKKLIGFTLGLALVILLKNYRDPMWTVCALLSIVPLCFYNGKAGRKNLQKAFYLFYPLHLGVLYLISIIIK